MSLLGQDVLVSLKMALGSESLSYAELGKQTGLSASQAHASVQRLAKSDLVVGEPRRANSVALLEFLVHGVKYVFPGNRGPVRRGIPTGHSAPPLNELISAGDEVPLVWAHPEGTVRGETLPPVYKSAPEAALKDALVYQGLALLDSIRAGRARERELAAKLLRKLLQEGR